MRKIKKLLPIIFLSFFILTTHTLPANGQFLKTDKKATLQNNVNTISAAGGFNQNDSLEIIIARIIRIILISLGTIFLALMFLAGQAWMRAAGNEQIIKESQDKIKSLLIGLIIVLSAYAVSSWVSKVLANLIQL